jgi:hypothetical protein
MKPKAGGNIGAEDMRMKIWFAAADNDRGSRRELMRELGRRGAKARMLKVGKRARKKIARTASKVELSSGQKPLRRGHKRNFQQPPKRGLIGLLISTLNVLASAPSAD